MSLIDDNTTSLLRHVAKFTEARHAVLTQNVAHASTPEYERRDLDVAGFQAALRRAVASRRTPHQVTNSAGQHLSTATIEETLDPRVFTPRPDVENHLRFHDAGVRSVETEMTELTKNTMLHSFAVELLNTQYDMLQAVISERP